MEFSVAAPPHVVAPKSVRGVMQIVLLALVPAIIVETVFFGWGLAVQIVLCTITALACEALALKLRRRSLQLFLTDGSALVTALLLALSLPPLAPWWLAVTGTACAVLLAKHAYGGLGFNLFNPAMVGYAILLVSFPAQLTSWPAPRVAEIAGTTLSPLTTLDTILTGAPPENIEWDGVTAPTQLAAMRSGIAQGKTLEETEANPIFGRFGGKGMEWVNLAVLGGGLALLILGIISWHIPVTMLGSLAGTALLMNIIDPGAHPGPVFHLTSGAGLLCAFFIATDPVSAATSNRGRLLYAAGIGVLTYVIRTWGGYPDGVAFAVLLMNLAVPLIDRYTVPRIYGHAE
jgi:electron transport complex protein RnfD